MNLFYKLKSKLFYEHNCLRARIQRFKRGYSYGDVWDMDYWFINTVKPMLIHLRDHGCGIPGELYVYGNNERANWENVLTEMINCLDLMDEDNAEMYLGIAYNDYSLENSKKTWDLMRENKNRFFELFNKYFYSLWD